MSAASYGTILVLAALALIDTDDVSSGLGWELVTGVGAATWIAHLYAELVGDHLRHPSAALDGTEVARAAADGLPILLAAIPPAIMLLLGRLEVLDERGALWAAVVIAVVQLGAIGAYVASLRVRWTQCLDVRRSDCCDRNRRHQPEAGAGPLRR